MEDDNVNKGAPSKDAKLMNEKQNHNYPGGRSVDELAPPMKGGVGLFLCLVNRWAKLYCDSPLSAAALWYR